MNENRNRSENGVEQTGITDDDMARIMQYLKKPRYRRHISDLEKPAENNP